MSTLQQLAPGSIFAGDYRVLGLLSAGGMGAVYVVEQLSTSKQRALKLMHPQLVADPTLRKRFELEAKIGARIDSEHVVEVQAAGVDAATGMPWLVMELLRGDDLAKTVERRGALPVAEVRAIFEQLCHAVGAAHAAGIVHRDLKPENIFLGQARRAGVSFTLKVLDFGIAKLAAEAGTKHTAAMGSPIWMSPEQTDRGAITPAADVWALGLIAFHLLTGRYFWRSMDAQHPTVTQLMREIVLDPIAPASARAAELRASLPIGFDAWFARCVVREPPLRFQDANAAWAELARVLDGAAAPLAATSYAAVPNAAAAPPSVVASAAAAPLPWEAPMSRAPQPPMLQTTSAPVISQDVYAPPARTGPPRAIYFGAIGAIVLGLAGVGAVKLVPMFGSYKDDVVTVCSSIVVAETMCSKMADPCDPAQKATIAFDTSRKQVKTSEGRALLASIGDEKDAHMKAVKLREAARDTSAGTCALADYFDQPPPAPVASAAPTTDPAPPASTVDASDAGPDASARGLPSGTRQTKPPAVREGATAVSGRLPPEVIQRVVRQSFGRFRACYANGLRNNPTLQGTVNVRFVISPTGAVSAASNAGSTLPDGAVVSCVVSAFAGLSFPQPEGGIVAVTYPITFTPGD